MNLGSTTILFAVYFLWLLIVTFIVFKYSLFYLRLTKDGKKESLSDLLDNIIKRESVQEKTIAQIISRCDKLEKESALHIQRIGLSRFNPFKDTGGDQSFILALVDVEDTGVIISSLHTRTGTRWYAKKVIKGKGVEYELSTDEQNALRGAKVLK